MRKGAPWLKTTLIQCAWAAARKKASYLQAQFHRRRARRGSKKAIGAVAASILTAAYHMLAHGILYHDLGPDHFDRRAKATQTRRLLTRLQNLGYAVQITTRAAGPDISFLLAAPSSLGPGLSQRAHRGRGFTGNQPRHGAQDFARYFAAGAAAG